MYWRTCGCAAAIPVVFLFAPVASATEGGSHLALGPMAMGLLGGLALFLMGMDKLSGGLKAAAGDRMRSFLERFTKNRVSAAMTGAVVTGAVQSSSITTVLVVGFVSANLMTLTQSVGVIMGAKVGSTLTAQIVAFSVDEYALALIAIGFLMSFIAKRERVRHLGAVVLGQGLVFFGMGLMSQAMSPLRTFEPFADVMARLAEVPVLALLVGAAFTALVQSSSATTSLIVVMASEGLVSLPAGIALALGANIGTCVTAALAAIGKPVDAQRAAAVHVLYSALGALIWLPFVDVLADVARSVSPAYPELAGAERLANEAPRQIANANTLFNVFNTVFFLFFAGFIAQLATWLIPSREAVEEDVIRPKFLDEALLRTPSFAVVAARRETARVGSLAGRMGAGLHNAIDSGDFSNLDAIQREAQRSSQLFRKIVDYCAEISRQDLTPEDAVALQRTTLAASEFKALNDLLVDRLMPTTAKRFSGKPGTITPKSPALIELVDLVDAAFGDAVIAVRTGDESAARSNLSAKPRIETALAALTGSGGAGVLGEDRDAFRRELEIGQILRLAYSLSRRAAKAVLPADAALATTD